MKNIKKLLFVGALVLGTIGISHAAWGNHQWNITTTTGTFTPIFTRFGYILSIRTSSGTTNSLGDYGMGVSTMPTGQNGSINGAFTDIFTATTTVIPPLYFLTTASSGTTLSSSWYAGTPDGAYVESDLYWIQSSQKNGGANQTTIIWSK